MIIRNYFQFEYYVSKVFEECGFEVERLYEQDGNKIDLKVKKNKFVYLVEIKLNSFKREAIHQLLEYTNNNDAIPIIVTGKVMSTKLKENILSKYKELIIIDLPNLLYATQYNKKLYNNILSILPETTDNIYEEKGFLESDILRHGCYLENLIGELKSCEKGKELFRKYEEICNDLLKSIFENDLCLWQEQKKSNHNLYRFDLICRIKEDNKSSFWSIIEKHFNSKYIIFEFKNYSNEITQKEIYTTEKYLYAKALRSVAIIISASGYNKNAYWAIKGTLREQGKLILLLTNEDLVEMCKMKLNNDNPSDFLLNKLDDLLLDLEK